MPYPYPIYACKPTFARSEHLAPCQQSSTYSHFEQVYHQLSRGVYSGLTTFIDFGGLFSIEMESFNQELDQWGAVGEDRFCIVFQTTDVPINRVGNQFFERDSVLCMSPGGDFDLRVTPETSFCAIIFRADFIEPLIKHFYPKLAEADRLIFPTTLAREVPILGALRSLISQLVEFQAGEAESEASAGRKHSLEFSIISLAAGLIADQAGQNVGEKLDVGHGFAKVAAIRKFMRQASGVDVQVERLASTFGMSRRQIEYLFRKRFDLSPNHYKKLILLNEFQAALLKPENCGRCIGDIAADFNIWHLSRLAQEYRELFGILPSMHRLSIQ